MADVDTVMAQPDPREGCRTCSLEYEVNHLILDVPVEWDDRGGVAKTDTHIVCLRPLSVWLADQLSPRSAVQLVVGEFEPWI